MDLPRRRIVDCVNRFAPSLVQQGKNMQAAVRIEASDSELFQIHHQRLVRLCRLLLRDPDEAQEVTQEVFEKLLRERQRGIEIMDHGAWLRRVAVNACRDRRRAGWWRWWQTRSSELDENSVVWSGAGPEANAVSREQRQAIWNAFRQLSTRQQEIFALRQIDGCSTEEVAATLGIATGSVKQHLFRAVQHMRKALRGSQ